MFKCGQKDNKNYTFGVTDKQIKEAQAQSEEIEIFTCSGCGQTSIVKTNFCSNCGGSM